MLLILQFEVVFWYIDLFHVVLVGVGLFWCKLQISKSVFNVEKLLPIVSYNIGWNVLPTASVNASIEQK